MGLAISWHSISSMQILFEKNVVLVPMGLALLTISLQRTINEASIVMKLEVDGSDDSKAIAHAHLKPFHDSTLNKG